MKARTIKGSSIEEIKKALTDALADGYKPTLCILFISIEQDRKAVCELFYDLGIEVIGATSSGEFVENHETTGGIVAMLLDLNRSSYKILFKEIGNDTLKETAQILLKNAYDSFANPAFILLTTHHSKDEKVIDGEGLIRYIENIAGPDLNLFGGMAGDDLSFTGTFVFNHELETDYGLVALVLDENKVMLRGMAISGWKPIGISRTVTKSKENLIYTIDDQPAFSLYLRFLGVEQDTIENQISFFNSEGVNYPLQIEREGRDPQMCNPIGYDQEKGALICESKVPQGASFRFSTPPDFDIVETILEKAFELKEKSNESAEALLVFSCAGRLSSLGPLAQQENDNLYELWNVPMAGFYTYGEFGRSESGIHEFHSTTNSWLVLNEK